MTNHTHETVQVGDLVAAAFDGAATHSSDPHEVSWLATRAVRLLLRGASKAATPPRAWSPMGGGAVR